MSKIQLNYDVPDGDYCLNVCEDKNVTPTCKYLHGDKWCTLFGKSPSYVCTNGHSMMLSKLYTCQRAEVKPSTTKDIPK